jgi:hypothetical protein
VQIEGEPGSLEGIFHASSVRKNSIYISYKDVPDPKMVPPLDSAYTGKCTDFDGATLKKPDNWLD